jgi:D-sedoheptulose 7-phosphate isomerase
MENLEYVKSYLSASLAVKKKLNEDESVIASIKNAAELVESAYRAGYKVLIAGNGGSAGDAQHIAAEFVSRFFYDRPGLPAIALTTDTSMLTAIGNDYGFKRLFSRQVQAQGNPGDVFIGISTSGNSENIIEAVSEAKKQGLTTVALCGEGGILSSLVDIALVAPSESTPHIQECHIVMGHIICGLVEERIFPDEKPDV